MHLNTWGGRQRNKEEKGAAQIRGNRSGEMSQQSSLQHNNDKVLWRLPPFFTSGQSYWIQTTQSGPDEDQACSSTRRIRMMDNSRPGSIKTTKQKPHIITGRKNNPI